MSYREAHLACYRGIGSAKEQEITGDEIRDHLSRSVLPRLATEGWILETSAPRWDPVQPARGVVGRRSGGPPGGLRRAARRRPPRGRPVEAADAASGPRPACSRGSTW